MSTIPYNVNHLSQWNPLNHAPWSQPSNQGYDVKAPQLSQVRRNAAYKRANGNLCDGSAWWPLFVSDLNIDLALAGSTAQSRFTRDFYPKNFTQPTFMISGQCLDQEDYGHLTEFVHQAQRNQLGSSGQMTQLIVVGWGYDGTRNPGKGVTKNGVAYPNQLIRGSHSTTVAMGYVMTMPRQHQKGVWSPTYQFGFVVAELLQGVYNDVAATQQAQQTWVDMLKSVQTLDTSPLSAQNQANLKWAQQNSVNILNSGQ